MVEFNRMARSNFLIVILFLSIALFAIHAYALKHFLYFFVPWFDSVVHLLGGFTLGLLVLIPSSTRIRSKKTLFTISILGALLFSIGWEIFEYKIGMTFVSPKHFRLYVYDTITDISCGTLGGFFAGYFGSKFLTIKK
jgi:uncharacterized membrane protein